MGKVNSLWQDELLSIRDDFVAGRIFYDQAENRLRKLGFHGDGLDAQIDMLRELAMEAEAQP